MITRRGWAVIGASAALAVAGRLIGLGEFYGLAGGGVGLVSTAFVLTRRRGSDVIVHRRITPARVHVGSPWRVEIRATNRGKSRSPLLNVSTTFSAGQRYARFCLAPLEPGATADAAFRLPSEKRGVFTLGPLIVERSDIFGLAASRVEAAPAVQLTVFPRIDPATSLDGVGVADPLAEVNGPRRVGAMGGDFFALTEYQQGDDMRRVHWPSVARTGRLMIRQEESPWRGRTTVVLDLRAPMHTEDSFEDALSAAASVLVAGGARNGLVRLVTTGPFDSGFGAGHLHMDRLLEVLALAEPQRTEARGGLAGLAGGSRRSTAAGAARDGACVVTTSRGAKELGPFLARDPHAVGIVFTFDDERVPAATRRGNQVVAVPVNSRRFGALWAAKAGNPNRRTRKVSV